MHEKSTPTHTDSQDQTLSEESTMEAPSPAIPETKTAPTKSVRIQTLNDLFRTTFIGGTVALTQGVHGLEKESRQALIEKVQIFSKFTEENDPYGEHDFGIIQHEDDTFYWKIDYFDKAMTCLLYTSPSPRD